MEQIVTILWIIAIGVAIAAASLFEIAFLTSRKEKPMRSVTVTSQSPVDVLNNERLKGKPITTSGEGVLLKGGVIHMTDEYEAQVLKGLEQ